MDLIYGPSLSVGGFGEGMVVTLSAFLPEQRI
jgi:hypothetical protein